VSRGAKKREKKIDHRASSRRLGEGIAALTGLHTKSAEWGTAPILSKGGEN